jgi:hypothetical protein
MLDEYRNLSIANYIDEYVKSKYGHTNWTFGSVNVQMWFIQELGWDNLDIVIFNDRWKPSVCELDKGVTMYARPEHQ